jgi:hypothetical protein
MKEMSVSREVSLFLMHDSLHKQATTNEPDLLRSRRHNERRNEWEH